MTTIAEELHIIRLTTGRDILLDTPEECEELLARAQSEGIEVSSLYVLSAPFSPYKGGSFLRRDRSMWVHYDQSRPDGLTRALRYELHELAHAENPLWRLREPRPGLGRGGENLEASGATGLPVGLGAPLPTWIPGRAVGPSWSPARAPPVCWLSGWEPVPRLSPASPMTPFATSASRKAGISPSSGRPWPRLSEDPLANGRVLDFSDRCLLRSWRVPYQRGGSFGQMRLRSTERSDRMLRAALRSSGRTPGRASAPELQKSRGTELCFIQVEEEQDFSQAIGALNGLLLDGAPGTRWPPGIATVTPLETGLRRSTAWLSITATMPTGSWPPRRGQRNLPLEARLTAKPDLFPWSRSRGLISKRPPCRPSSSWLALAEPTAGECLRWADPAVGLVEVVQRQEEGYDIIAGR